MRRSSLALLVLLTTFVGCKAPDPSADFTVSDVDAYWAVDPEVGNENYIAPAVRFTLKNRGPKPIGSVQATATFKRVGETETWGSDWKQVAVHAHPMQPGQTTVVMMKSERRYHSATTPEKFFQHEQWKDVTVEVFLKEGSSGWTKFATATVARHIGTKDGAPLAAVSPIAVPPIPPSPH
jgi:hypothetical protein